MTAGTDLAAVRVISVNSKQSWNGTSFSTGTGWQSASLGQIGGSLYWNYQWPYTNFTGAGAGAGTYIFIVRFTEGSNSSYQVSTVTIN